MPILAFVARRVRGPLAAAALLAGCGSPPPGSVDVEAKALDLAGCIRGDARCVRAGRVEVVEQLGAVQTLRIDAPGSVTLPLLAAEGAPKLTWLGLGIYAANPPLPERCRAQEEDRCDGGAPPCTCTTRYGFQYACQSREDGSVVCFWLDHGGRVLEVHVEGAEPVSYEPSYGFSRVEIDTGGVAPPPDARVTITAVEGWVELVYAAGGWRR